jgi:hypothetical protein
MHTCSAPCYEDVCGSGGKTAPFLKSVLDGVEWPVSIPSYFTPNDRPRGVSDRSAVEKHGRMSSSGMLRCVLVTPIVQSSQIIVTLMMEEIDSSETSVLTRATRRNIPGDGILHNHRRENPKSFIVFLYGEATHRNIRRLETLRTKNTQPLCTFPLMQGP